MEKILVTTETVGQHFGTCAALRVLDSSGRVGPCIHRTDPPVGYGATVAAESDGARLARRLGYLPVRRTTYGTLELVERIELRSAERYNGGAAVKRRHGSSTVTIFFVYLEEEMQDFRVEGFGKTPGDRKTDAKKRAIRRLLNS